jgi:hypothetical protein
MNGSQPPPFGDATDEAVSALLDDELDDFAAAHGTTVDAARRELTAWPGFDARQRELQRARRAFASEPVELDPLARRRLVSTAVDAVPAPPHARRRSPWRLVAVAAAVVVVLGAAGFGLSRLGGGGSASSNASKAATRNGATASAAYVGAVGEVANTDVLRAVISQQQAGLPVHAPGEFSTPAAGTPDARRSPAASGTTTAAEAQAARGDASRCAKAVAGRDPVTFLATATYQGRPAVVVGVHRGTRTVAFVLERTSCAVITAESL